MFHRQEGAEQIGSAHPCPRALCYTHSLGWGRAEGPWGHPLPTPSLVWGQRDYVHVLSPELLHTG